MVTWSSWFIPAPAASRIRSRQHAMMRARPPAPPVDWGRPRWPRAKRAGLQWLAVVVHRELVRRRAEPDRVEFLGPLVVQPGLDQVGGEHPALQQVVVVR